MEILKSLQAGGATLRRQGGHLVVRAPEGLLTAPLAQAIRAHRDELLALVPDATGAACSAPPIVPIDRTQHLPLGLTQWRFWYLASLAPETAVYNLPAAFELLGPLQFHALESAINDLIARHEILRTRISLRSDGPVQEVLPAIDFRLAQIDLSGVPADRRSAALKTHIDRERDIPIPMFAAPMFRAQLFKLSETDHVLFWMPHHVVWDGWSFDIFLKELGESYQSYSCGKRPDIVTPRVQYADYAWWQRNHWEAGEWEPSLAFWRTQLSGEVPVLQLPTDRPRPEMMSFRGQRIPLSLPPAVIAGLKELGRAEDATLFMVLLAGFFVLLQRYSGQRDLIIGSPVQARNHPDLENLIGAFVNTLLLRIQVDPGQSFREVVRAVRDRCLETYDHQDTPFSVLVDEFEAEHTLSRNPLFQVLFSYQDVTNRSDHWGELRCEQIHVESSVAPTDLTVWVMETGRGLVGGIDYASDLFDAESIAALATHYTTLLASVANCADQSVGSVKILSPDEQNQLICTSAGADVRLDRESVDQPIFRMASRHPSKVAIRSGEHSLSYSDLVGRAQRIAAGLRQQGIGPGTLVGVLMERSMDLLPVLLGIFRSGAGYVPLDPEFPVNRIQTMVADSQVRLIVTDTRRPTNQPVDLGIEALPWNEFQARGETTEEDFRLVDDPERVAYVIYTSGSTGRPKGVQIGHSAIINLLQSLQNETGFGPDDRLLAVTTLSFDISVLELFLPLFAGGCVEIAPQESARDGVRLRELIERVDPDLMQATPATWRMLKDAGWAGSRSLTVLCGGEEMPRDLAHWLVQNNRRVANVYGPTETTVWSSLYWVGAEETAVAIGRPLANTQIYVLDEQMNLAPVGIPGELFIGGSGLAIGYHRLPELTRERFSEGCASVGGRRIYRTGDRGYWRRDGMLVCCGRTDTQVKVRGFRIELGEVEHALLQLPEIREAAVIVERAPGSDARLVAVVAFQPGQDATPTEIRRSLRQSLPEYMIPSAFSVVAQLPKTPNGKLDRAGLLGTVPRLIQPRRNVRLAASDHERLIAGICCDLLAIETIDMDENFFDLGGTSLLAMRCIARIAEASGQLLSPREFFFRTIGQIAGLLDQVSAQGPQGGGAPLGSTERMASFHGL